MIKEVPQIVICQHEQIIKEQPQKKCHLSIHEVQNSKGVFSTVRGTQQRQTEFTREKFFCPHDDDDVSWGSSSFLQQTHHIVMNLRVLLLLK